jgi:hypothetical protein
MLPTREEVALAEAAHELQYALGIHPMDGGVGITKIGWLVIIYAQCKRPPLIRWRGRPVEYRIGGGMPIACAA